MEKPQNERYEACFRLFLLHNGKNLCLIEREMRALGNADFNRRILYGRKEKGIYKPGWIERFGWRGFLGSPPYEGGVAAASADGVVLSNAANLQHELNHKSVSENHPPAEAAGPLLRKEGSFESASQLEFQSWLKSVSPDMTWDWKYQKYIYSHLQRITSGESKRLMIFLPPRHGKSELVTVRYAGWRLWNDPKMRIIVSSYNQRLADKFSRSIRRLLSEEEDKLREQLQETSEPVRLKPRNESEVEERSSPLCGTEVFVRSAPANERMFPPSRKINSASQWETAVGGGVKAVGVGAGVTGFGAQLIIIDDPVKNRAEAESETLREKVWDWYRNDLYTRLEPNASIVLIQTRWHEDDLAGRLLNDMADGGDQWEVVNLPALAEPRAVATGLRSLKGTKIIAQGKAESRNPGIECNPDPDPEGVEPSDIEVAPLQGANNSSIVPGVTLVSLANPRLLSSSPSATGITDPIGRREGAALCPERFDEHSLEKIRHQLGGYAFSALYQQRPTPAEGGIFKRAWFKRFVSRAPERLKWKRGYDLAVSTKTSACYTSSFRVAYDDDGNLYIADGFRKRIEFPEQRRYIVSRLIEEKDTEHGIEKALHGQAIIQDLRRDPSVRGSNLRGVTVSTDKLTRALKWAPLAEEGKVILVRGPWNQAFLDEICKFPGGHFDDQVDAVSLAVAMFQDKGSKLHVF